MNHSSEHNEDRNRRVEQLMYRRMLDLEEQVSSALGAELYPSSRSPLTVIKWAQVLSETRGSELPPGFDFALQSLIDKVNYLTGHGYVFPAPSDDERYTTIKLPDTITNQLVDIANKTRAASEFTIRAAHQWSTMVDDVQLKVQFGGMDGTGRFVTRGGNGRDKMILSDVSRRLYEHLNHEVTIRVRKILNGRIGLRGGMYQITNLINATQARLHPYLSLTDPTLVQVEGIRFDGFGMSKIIRPPEQGDLLLPQTGLPFGVEEGLWLLLDFFKPQ